MADEPDRTADSVPAGAADQGTADRATNRGPGRVLIAIYLLFAIAASARAGYQIATRFGDAPLAYLLSALAAAIYIVATVGLSRGDAGGRRVAVVCCTVEVLGVVAVGFLSVFDRQLFPDDTVWSGFGQGYGYVPLVLPVLGLLWLRHTRTRRSDPPVRRSV